MDSIKAAIEAGQLPDERNTLVSSLLQNNETFVPQEGLLWDFKCEWPFSYSNDYFAAIARLICSFANSYGGVILFGVHDDLRTAGHNKVAPNMDRLQQALDQITSDRVDISCRRYDVGKITAIDALLVRPQGANQLPVRFIKPIANQKEGIIWVSQNHEVVAAEPRHVPLLYCRAPQLDNSEDDTSLSGGLIRWKTHSLAHSI